VTLAVIVVSLCAIIACTLDTSKPPSLLPSETPDHQAAFHAIHADGAAACQSTPIGGPISVASPLPTPALSTLAISPSNVDRITETLRLSEPTVQPGSFGPGFTRDGQWLVSAWDRLSIWQMPNRRTHPLTADSLWPVDAHRAQPGRPMGGCGEL